MYNIPDHSALLLLLAYCNLMAHFTVGSCSKHSFKNRIGSPVEPEPASPLVC
jgi:hypothetical protein